MGTAEESRCDFYSAAVVNAKRVSPNTNPAEEVKGCAAVGGDGGGATDEDEDGRHDEPDGTEIGAEDGRASNSLRQKPDIPDLTRD